MAEYVDITSDEMTEFLSPLGFVGVTLPNTRELVFAKRVDVDGLALSLRVYTGINPDGHSRDAGSDAIRCNIFWRKEPGEMRKVWTSKRVHRVKGWRDNLGKRLSEAKIDGICDKCGAPMVLRKGRNGHFLGCGNFPDCRNTKEA